MPLKSVRRVLALALSLGFGTAAQAESRMERLLKPYSTTGVWLTNSPSTLYYDRARIGEAMKELQVAGFNRVLPNVWSRGITFYPSAYALV